MKCTYSGNILWKRFVGNYCKLNWIELSSNLTKLFKKNYNWKQSDSESDSDAWQRHGKEFLKKMAMLKMFGQDNGKHCWELDKHEWEILSAWRKTDFSSFWSISKISKLEELTKRPIQIQTKSNSIYMIYIYLNANCTTWTEYLCRYLSA